MYSSTPSLDSSLVLKEPGSSSTSPSRLPRMLVEYQPLRPSRRALNPGARIVLISVCPVFKCLQRLMRRARLDEGFRRSAPDCDQARCTRTFLELANVGANLLGKIHLV